jgi:hypothetical protein
MYDRGNRRANKSKQTARSKRPQVKDASWQLADEQLDDALRQTFPASDALSIIQNACGDQYTRSNPGQIPGATASLRHQAARCDGNARRVVTRGRGRHKSAAQLTT